MLVATVGDIYPWTQWVTGKVAAVEEADAMV